MWLALSKIAVCFATAYGRGREAAKRLLGAEFDGVLVTDQYAGYRFIDADQRQLCWAHVAQSRGHRRGEQCNQPIGARLVLLADAVFRTGTVGKAVALSKQNTCAGSRVTGKAGEASWSAASCCAANATMDDASCCCGMTRCCGGFMTDDEIALTNNEAERALRGYVLWRKGSYGVWSHRGELFRQRILSLVETGKTIGPPQTRVVEGRGPGRASKTDYPIPAELMPSTDPGGLLVQRLPQPAPRRGAPGWSGLACRRADSPDRRETISITNTMHCSPLEDRNSPF